MPGAPMSVAVVFSTSAICAELMYGKRCSNTATAPVTCGVAIEVPFYCRSPTPGWPDRNRWPRCCRFCCPATRRRSWRYSRNGREAADGVRHAVGRSRILRHAGDRQPVRRDVRHEVGQPADHIRLVVVAVVTGGKQHQNIFARGVDGALIACAGQAAEQRFDLIELFLRILQLKVQRVRIAAAVGQKVGNTDAPAVVDHPHAVVDHRLPAGIGDGAVRPRNSP